MKNAGYGEMWGKSVELGAMSDLTVCLRISSRGSVLP